MPRWNTWDGAYRAAGQGRHGYFYGSHVWTLDAAKDRRKSLAKIAFRSWVERFTDGTWRRVGDIEVTPEETLPAE